MSRDELTYRLRCLAVDGELCPELRVVLARALGAPLSDGGLRLVVGLARDVLAGLETPRVALDAIESVLDGALFCGAV